MLTSLNKAFSMATMITLILFISSTNTCGELCSRCERGKKCTVCYQTIVQDVKCDMEADRSKFHCRFGFLLNNGYCTSCPIQGL